MCEGEEKEAYKDPRLRILTLCNTWSRRGFGLFVSRMRSECAGICERRPHLGGAAGARAKMGASVGLSMKNQQREVKAALEQALVIDVAVTYVDREATAQSFP